MLDGKQSTIGRTRRQFLRPGSAKNHHIASVLVHARAEAMTAVEAALTRISGIESHGSDGCRLIVTIETGSDAHLVDAMTRIQDTQGVVTAALIYHHVEEELGDER